jgi:hypothetical protein
MHQNHNFLKDSSLIKIENIKFYGKTPRVSSKT